MDNKRREANRRRNRKLRHKYGITLTEMQSILAKQGGVCAICGTDYPGVQGWHIDHNHGTGEVRGVLCQPCNSGLGQFGDTPDLLDAAADYLE